MPKRNSDEKIEWYQRKIRKLKKKQQRQRIIYSLSSDSDEKTENEIISDNVVQRPLDAAAAIINEDLNIDMISTKEQVLDQDQIVVQDQVVAQNDASVLQLDPSILSALGEVTEEAPKFGPKIHEQLSNLWLPILRKGMNKDAKDKLIKEHPIPENCSLIQAPKLNPEISAAVNEGARTRDKRVENVQQQLGHGIAALNKGLELLLDNGEDKLQVIKYLSDSCRLLCDLHFIETEARKKFITPGLDKSFLNVIQDTERDDLLFGSKLSEKIKATKVIEKHGLQIKKAAPIAKTIPFQQPSTSRARPQGNWMGPPRFPSNRGGRGGQRKPTSVVRRAQSGGAVQMKQSTQSKQRATTHQQ